MTENELQELQNLLDMDGVCTDRQREVISVVVEVGTISAAASVLGLIRATVQDSIRSAKKRAAKIDARQGKAPGYWDYGSPEGYSVGKVTLSVNHKTGEVERSWPRMNPDADNGQSILDAISARAERIEPLPEITTPSAYGSKNLFNQISIFDGHLGAHAWHPETGSGHWDLKIARRHLTMAAKWLINNLPAAMDCLVLIGGDFTEVDGYKPLTPEHGHLLDADGRYPRIFEVAEDVIEATVIHALQRHRHVTLCLRPGNHDKQTIFALRRVFMRVFKNNPRVTVDESLKEYWAMEFGKTMIACQHGDKVGLERLPMIFAADMAEMWGRTTYRIAHTGHWHHQKTIQSIGAEKTGMMVFQHPTMERRNAWAAGKGLIAARQLVGHSYHSGGALITQLHYNADLHFPLEEEE